MIKYWHKVLCWLGFHRWEANGEIWNTAAPPSPLTPDGWQMQRCSRCGAERLKPIW
jgi:hypothetical protein